MPFKNSSVEPLTPRLGVTLPVDQAGDCVHAQAVSVEHLQPVVGAGLDKAADLAAGVHEVAAAPLALANGCGRVLVQRGAVKFFQAVVVDRKVYRHKVQNDADALFMAGVDELGQLLGCRSGWWGRKSR